MNTNFTPEQIAENINNFDFNALFAACGHAKKLDFSTPVTIEKKEVKRYVSNLPESCVQLNGLRELFKGIR
jgi:hypothetical protein